MAGVKIGNRGGLNRHSRTNIVITIGTIAIKIIEDALLQAAGQTHLLSALVEISATRELLQAAGLTHHCGSLVGIAIDRELLQGTVQTRPLEALVAQAVLASCKASVRRLSVPPSATAAGNCLACRAA